MPVVLADALRLVLPRHTSLGVCGRERRPRALFLTLSLTFFIRRRGGRRRLGRHELKCMLSIFTLLEGQTVLDEVLEVVCCRRRPTQCARARPPSSLEDAANAIEEARHVGPEIIGDRWARLPRLRAAQERAPQGARVSKIAPLLKLEVGLAQNEQSASPRQN